MIAVHYGPGDGVDGEGLKLLADIWDAVKETELRQTCDNKSPPDQPCSASLHLARKTPSPLGYKDSPPAE